MRKYSCLLVLLMMPTAFAKEVALTIDDAPRENENIFSGTQRTKKMIEVLKRRKIQSVFFCNSAKFDQANGHERIEMYAQAGHLIANHTHSHPSLADIPVEDFIREIDRADDALKNFSTFKKWFRYPYLQEGTTAEVRNRVHAHLKERNYTIGYVTADNYDYLINDLVQQAIFAKKKVNMTKACDMLIDLSLEGLEYQNGLKPEKIGQPKQVLLMHENDLEVICMDQLINRLQGKGWKIISPTEAFKGPNLNAPPPMNKTISSLTEEFYGRGIVEN